MNLVMEIAGQTIEFPFAKMEEVRSDLKSNVLEIDAFLKRDAFQNGNGKRKARATKTVAMGPRCATHRRTFRSAAGLAAHIRIVHEGKVPKRQKEKAAK